MEEGQDMTWVLSGSFWLQVEKRLSVGEGGSRENRGKASAETGWWSRPGAGCGGRGLV